MRPPARRSPGRSGAPLPPHTAGAPRPSHAPGAPRSSRPHGQARGTGGRTSSAAEREVLWGQHAALAAWRNPERVVHRLLLVGDEPEPWARQAPSGIDRPQPERVAADTVSRLVPNDAVHQGIVLIADPLAERDVDSLAAALEGAASAIVVMLDQVSDPHNVGAILRSAAAFGAAAVIVQDRHSPRVAGTLAKAASGTMELVPLVRGVNLARSIERLKAAGFWSIGLDGGAATTLAAMKPGGKTLLVLGSEGAGLRRNVAAHCDLLARLPMDPRVESLNVSNAAAVALYELVRDAPRPGA